MSTYEVGSFILITSGALYNGVVFYPKVVWVCFIVSKSYLDIPKSPIQRSFLLLESSVMNMFPGFKSLWQMFLLWRKSKPRRIIAKYSKASSSVKFFYLRINFSKSPPDAYFVTMQSFFYSYGNSSMN